MLDFVTRPIRSALGLAKHEVVAPIQESRDIEAHILEAVHAIHSATASIEQHVEVIETLATSVAPFGASVDRLTDTMQDLVRLPLRWGMPSAGSSWWSTSSATTATRSSRGKERVNRSSRASTCCVA
jgi:hypothetical protein